MELSQQVVSQLKIKIAIDTQILAYLIDNSYPKLSSFFQMLFESPYVDVVCSRFTTYEFIGIRKLEHYLRCIHNKCILENRLPNFSSLLKYKNDWNAPELPYQEIFETVKKNVEDDLKNINNNFGIIYNSHFNQNLWQPHQELVLGSKISKEDSLVLLSNIFPDSTAKEHYLIFFTNDDQFFRAYCGNLKMQYLDTVFESYQINSPIVFKVSDIAANIDFDKIQKIDLIKGQHNESSSKHFLSLFLKQHLLKKSSDLYIGRVASCPASMKGKLLCFILEAQRLDNNIYITIVSKDFNFIYYHEVKLSNFYNKEKLSDYPYIPSENPDSRKISVELKNETGEYLSHELYSQISITGNLIFIHPDSL